MDFELAKALKDAGFPQKNHRINCYDNGCFEFKGEVCVPTLEELIEACGNNVAIFQDQPTMVNKWTAIIHDGLEKAPNFLGLNVFVTRYGGRGKTPSEAVARLWLALNKK